MRLHLKPPIAPLRHRLTLLFSGLQPLVFLPALVLAGFWIGGEIAMVLLALGLPVLLALAGLFDRMPAGGPRAGDDPFSDLHDHAGLEKALDKALSRARPQAHRTGCFLIQVDDFDGILDRHGPAAAETVDALCLARLKSTIRHRDRIYRMGDGLFGAVMAPVRHLDTEIALQLATRLQNAVEEPVTLDATTIYVSASVGFCLDGAARSRNGAALGDAAAIALADAGRHTPSAIRAYSRDMQTIGTPAPAVSEDVIKALESGEIRAWFQPQVCTDTGRISGFEALARWIHPERGLIAPAEFLPALEQSGKTERLGEIMLRNGLDALTAWQAQGFDIPHIGVNFAPDELRNPRLVEKIAWQLDRYDLAPERLSVEILETVVATSPDDTITRNIKGLSELGCLIDLDDFGTGHASISSIRRFAVNRLKIDRSFVMKVDRDPDQQRMISAILMMAEQLGLETLAEGVETAGEHAILAQLGCRHVQGFGIARPMPFEQTDTWIRSHLGKLRSPPVIGLLTR